MTTTLSPRPEVRREVAHPPHRRTARRSVGIVDRLALRVGLMLIVWSRRPRRTVDCGAAAERMAAVLAERRRAQDAYWRDTPLR